MRKNTYHNIIFFACVSMLVVLLDSCKSKSLISAKNAETAAPGKVNTNLDRSNTDNKLKFQTSFYNACKEKIKGNIEIAENLYKECIKIDPSSSVAKYELAHIYFFAGKQEEALHLAREAANSNVLNEWYQLLYIECLHKKRFYADAVNVYERLVKNFPNHLNFYEELATEYLYAQKPDKAFKTYEDIEKKFGKTPGNSIAKIKVLKQEKKWHQAEAALKSLILESPKESQYYTFLAELYQDSNQPEKAFETYQEILKIDPSNPYIHLTLADYYRSQRKDAEFYNEVKIAFNSEDLDIDNKVKILMSYYSLTEQYPQYKENAYELCGIMLKIHSGEAKAHSMYGDFLFRDKKLKEAKDEYERVIELDKSKYAIWTQLMICESELNDYTNLLKHSTEAIDLFPSQAIPYFLNGVANLRLNNYAAAIEAFNDGQEFVFDNEPLQIQFLINIGEAYNLSKKFEKSDNAFENALKLDPENALILNNYAYYLSLRKSKLEYAEKLSKHALDIQPESISFMDTYGWIFYQQNKYQEAKKWLEKALQAGADKRPAILEHYGDVLFQLKETEKALEFWQKAKDNGGKSEMLDKKIADKKLYD